MKVKTILADHVASHPDSTFSLLRGGINRFNSPPGKTSACKAAALIRIEAEPAEIGEHSFELVLMGEDGQLIVPSFTGKFRIPGGGAVANLIVEWQAVLSIGKYRFDFKVNGIVQDSYPFQVTVEEKGEAS